MIGVSAKTNEDDKMIGMINPLAFPLRLREKGKGLISSLSSIFTFTLSFIILSSAVHASFEDIGTGARATALGGAFTPLADDIYALSYNPAGLVYLKRKEFSATYALLHTALADKSKLDSSYVAYGHPFKPEIGTFGLAWNQTNLEGLYGERTFTLGYGRRLSQRVAIGANIKQLYRQFTAPSGQTSNIGITDPTKSDPLFGFGNSKSNLSLDAGILYRPYRNYAFGVNFADFNEPDMALTSQTRDAVPMTMRLGIAYNERTLTLLGQLDTKKSPSGQGRDAFATVAAEKWWLAAGFAQGDLALRGSLGFGSRSFSQLTVGLSYKLDALQLDYAFLMPLSGVGFGSSQGNHRITFTLRFGKTQAEPDYELRMRAAEIAAKKAEEELERVRRESEKLSEELEKLKSEAEKRKAEIEQTRARVGKEAAVKETAARFSEEMDRYWKRKAAGATVDERIGILTQVLKIFSGSGIDLSIAEKELAVVKSDRARAEMDLAISWSYYQKIVARGASVPERIELLSRMIDRFARTGADLTAVREELKALRGR